MRPLPQALAPPPQNIDYRKYRPQPAPHLSRLALIAPGLSESELRVLLDLSARALPSPDLTCKVSLSTLATSTRSSKKSVIRAIAALSERGLIIQRSGSPTAPSAFKVLIFDAVNFSAEGGVTMTPPPPGGSVTMTPPPEANLFQAQPDPQTAPDVHFDSIEDDSITNASIDTDFPLSPDQENTLRRVAAARPRDFAPDLIRSASAQLGHLRRKLGRDPADRHAPNPDPTITAQFLAVSKWPILADFISLVLCDRLSPGRSNAWWITVAIERIHGITPDQQREFRLRSRPRPQIARTLPPPDQEKTPPSESPDADTAAQNRKLISELADSKTLRRR
mgnify:CR=1 FL=1